MKRERGKSGTVHLGEHVLGRIIRRLVQLRVHRALRA